MAEIHPNDIGLATYEDVGDVKKLLTVAKNIVAAINELYQNSSDIGDALGKQLYVDGENNVIIGQNNVVHGSNNLIVGSDNVIVGDNYSIFADNYKRYSLPPGGDFYNYDISTNTAYFGMMESEYGFDIPVGAKVLIKLSAYWYNSSYSDMVYWDSPLQFGEISSVNTNSYYITISGVEFEAIPPDEEHTICNEIYISEIIILDDKYKVNGTKNSSFVFGDGLATGFRSFAAAGGYASGSNSFAVNSGGASGLSSAAVNTANSSGNHAFASNDGVANGQFSTAINKGAAEVAYGFASGVYTKIFGRAYKCISFDIETQTAVIETGKNTKGIVGKKVILPVYNRLNPIIYNDGEIVSVDENKIVMKGFDFPNDTYNDYSFFPEIYLFVIDTETQYARGSQAGGYYSIASGVNSVAFGNFVRACADGAVIFGQNGSLDAPYSLALANGTSRQDMQLAFKVLSDGSVHADAEYTTPCADYAEFFEWADGNPDKEDRVGYFVKLDGEKIVKCGDFDKPLGIISATPAIIGDGSEMHWKHKYVTDDFGRIKYHDVLVPEQKDEEGNIVIEEHMETQPMISPDWNADEEYIPRSKRLEWAPVGVLGKLIVYDDGTLSPGDICRPGEGGIAVKSITNGYPVLKRIAEDKVLVWFKE